MILLTAGFYMDPLLSPHLYACLSNDTIYSYTMIQLLAWVMSMTIYNHALHCDV